MSNEWPILMQPDLALKALEELKTQTRRLNLDWLKVQNRDRLWVRETWATEARYDHLPPREVPTKARVWWASGKNNVGRAHGELDKEPRGKWRPNIHMPRWCSRLNLLATENAYAQKLHDITDADAWAEGITVLGTTRYEGQAVHAFERLWDRINGESCSWKSNPNVVVLHFRRVKS